MASATQLELSRNDAKVLHALFDGEGSTSGGSHISRATSSLSGVAEEEYERLHKTQSEALKAINVPEPNPSAVKGVIRTLSEIIDKQPLFAPAYTNRAQATRLLVNDDDIFKSESSGHLHNIVDDLQRAISQCSPASLHDSLSPVRAHTLATSYTHLAYLLLLASRTDNSELPETLRPAKGKSAEDMASEMFRLGGLYGNKIAQEMAVKTNPYAKLCGEMVKEALKEDMRAAGAFE